MRKMLTALAASSALLLFAACGDDGGDSATGGLGDTNESSSDGGTSEGGSDSSGGSSDEFCQSIMGLNTSNPDASALDDLDPPPEIADAVEAMRNGDRSAVSDIVNYMIENCAEMPSDVTMPDMSVPDVTMPDSSGMGG